LLVKEVDAVSPEALQHLLDDLTDVVGPAVPPSVRNSKPSFVARTTSSQIGSSASPTSVMPYSVSNLGCATGCQPASPFAQHARPSPCGFLGQTFINSVVHIGRETARENDSLRAELSQPPADAMDQVTDQAVSVLNQAQQLADSLIDEAMQSARDLLSTALPRSARSVSTGTAAASCQLHRRRRTPGAR
jgi:hypothetical protein